VFSIRFNDDLAYFLCAHDFLINIVIGPNSTWLDSTRLDTFESIGPCFSNMADDEETVVLGLLASTSLVFCAVVL